jgi:hypothetical protein
LIRAFVIPAAGEELVCIPTHRCSARLEWNGGSADLPIGGFADQGGPWTIASPDYVTLGLGGGPGLGATLPEEVILTVHFGTTRSDLRSTVSITLAQKESSVGGRQGKWEGKW